MAGVRHADQLVGEQLRELGIPLVSVQKQITRHNIQHSLDILNTQDLSKKKLLKAAKCMLPVVNNPAFITPLMSVLNQLSGFVQGQSVVDIYEELTALQKNLLCEEDSSSLPAPLLHFLWMTYLPSLEYALLSLVSAVVCKKHNVRESAEYYIRKIHLIEIGLREPAVHRAVCSFLSHLHGKTHNACVATLLELYQGLVSERSSTYSVDVSS